MKGNARKVRRLYKDQIIAGFAGGTADAFTLFERFEASSRSTRPSHAFGGRAGQGLAHRSHPAPARSAVGGGGQNRVVIITGQGDVIEPEGGLIAIGSGGRSRSRCARPARQSESVRATLSNALEYRRRHLHLYQS